MYPRTICLLLATLFSCLVLQGAIAQIASDARISGEIVGGLRLLTLVPGQANDFVVYRGDYVQPRFSNGEQFTINIPTLKVEMNFPVKVGEAAYIKMKKPGRYSFSAADASGTIRVIDYAAASYTELSAEQAQQILRNTDPLLLDVRTPGEFDQGYIEGALLLPVQELQQNLSQLEEYKDRDVLIYCASGNRSTVASRLLIENGFRKIYNLRHGFNDWTKRGYPVVH